MPLLCIRLFLDGCVNVNSLFPSKLQQELNMRIVRTRRQ